MAQLPDGDNNMIGSIVAAITGIIGSLGAAYAVVRKTKSETTREAAQTAQTTVQATLDAMKVVIDGLIADLKRKDKDLEELREEVHTLQQEKNNLESKAARQERQIEMFQDQTNSMSRTITALKFRLEKLEGGGSIPC